MTLKIISADERLRERRGAKVMILGPTGVGKTSLLRTLDPAHTLFIDVEAGDLAVLDLQVDTLRVDDWATARDLACRIGGPNKSFPPTAAFSEAHFQAVGGFLEDLERATLPNAAIKYRLSQEKPPSGKRQRPSAATPKRDISVRCQPD